MLPNLDLLDVEILNPNDIFQEDNAPETKPSFEQ